MGVPTFIVGTGRCGSTMLSNMLREHPKVLSLSEFFAAFLFGGRTAIEPLVLEPMDGREFWSIVAGVNAWNAYTMRRGVLSPALLYPCDDSTARFSRQTGVPAPMSTALPHLSGQAAD